MDAAAVSCAVRTVNPARIRADAQRKTSAVQTSLFQEITFPYAPAFFTVVFFPPNNESNE
jgi:hypothetical protein